MAFNGVVKQVRLNATTVSNVVTYDVVVKVENPDEILIPGMTAYVNVIIAEKKNVLLIPNAALRYKPTSTVAPNKEKPSEQKPKKEKKESNSATVYVFENGVPKPIKVGIGVSDNRFTEIMSDVLKAGDKIIVEEVKNNANGSKNSPSPMRPF